MDIGLVNDLQPVSSESSSSEKEDEDKDEVEIFIKLKTISSLICSILFINSARS